MAVDKIKLLVEYIQARDIKKLKNLFSENSRRVKNALKQWKIEDHEVNKRPPKLLKDGPLEQAKLPMPWQKKIVNSSLAFLFGKPVKYQQANSEDISPSFTKFLEIKKDIRSHTKDRDNARRVFSETESAKLFVPYRGAGTDPYDLENTAINLRCIILAKSLGDTLYTCFDDYGSMIAFGRGYKVQDSEGKYIEHFDVYMNDFIYFMDDEGGEWTLEQKPNLIKKIPVVYYSQELSEWSDVQPLIERYEMLNSKRADTNDYTADPILLLRGGAKTLPGKDTVGKVVILEGDKADASYLAPTMAVDMIKDERQTLETQIHYFTDTPHLNDEQLRSLGQDSGKALEMRFFPAVLKAMSKQEMFEEMLDRENNIIKAFMTNILFDTGIENVEISMEFGNPLPDNIEDLINILSTATQGKAVMSQQTAVANNPLVDDPKKEMKLLEAQQKADMLTENPPEFDDKSKELEE